jgi:hypothetical protein
LYDNTFISLQGDPGPAIQFAGAGGNLLISFGNTFTVTNQSNVFEYVHTPLTLILEDQVVPQSSITWTVPTIPGFQETATRPTFYAVPNNQSALLEVLQQALQRVGERPVIYFPSGTFLFSFIVISSQDSLHVFTSETGSYPINESIVLPPNADIQFMGEESPWSGSPPRSFLIWTGNYSGKLFSCLRLTF